MSTTQLRPTGTAPVRAARPRRVLIGLAGLQFGGCQINALDLAAGLRDAGEDVVVFAVADESVKVSVLPYAASVDVPVLVLPGGGLVSTARQVRRLAAQHDSDVVHVFAPWLGIVAGLAAAGSRAAIVVTNWNMTNSFWGPAHAPLLVGTGSMAEEAQRCHRGPVHLTTPPVDVEKDVPDPLAGAVFRGDLEVDADHVLLVLVGRVDRVMKLESIRTAVLAVELMDDPLTRLAVVGDGDALDEVRALADEVNARLGRRAVLVTGALLDPHPAYAAADVVLAMGGAALRGLAHGRPLVVLGEEGFSILYDDAGREHVDREGFYGLGCDGDPVAHLAHLLSLLREHDVREALGRAGRADVLADYGLAAGVGRLQDIYASAVARRPGRLVVLADAAAILARAVRGRGPRAVRTLLARGSR